MGLDTLGALAVLGAVAYWVGWKDYLQPALRRAIGASSVKRSAPPAPPARRSRSQNVRTLARGRSARQEATERRSAVRPANAAIVAVDSPAGVQLVAGDTVSLDRKELTALGTALRARGAGASIEAAIRAGWGLGKGGGPAYVRARELFDAAGGAAKPERQAGAAGGADE